jgi:L-amino acid N-acyltransferase YncA
VSEVVSLRQAQPGDAAGIACVHVETWRNAYAGVVPNAYLVAMTEARQAVQWDGLVRRPARNESVVVAEAVGPRGLQIVGFGSSGRSRGSLAAGEVYTLYVGNDWQGQGIGGQLLAAMFQRLAARRMNDAVIWVLSANPSRYFYEAMGGARVAHRQERFAGSMLDETAYAWRDLTGWLQARGR